MDSPLSGSGSSPRRRRFGRAAAGAGHRHSASALAAGASGWLQRHPVAAAAFYMLIGGSIVYALHSTSSSGSQLGRQHDDGIVRLAALQASNPAATPAPATFSKAEAAEQAALCSDTCYKASDGVCDDGRFLHNMTRGLASTVLCDLGTDCSDCGPWTGVQHSSSWTEAVGPVEWLRQHNLTVLTKKTSLEPRFFFAYTDSAHDIDASRDFELFSVLETRLSHIAYHVLHGPCQQGAAVGGGVSSSSGSGAGTGGDNTTGSGQQQQPQPPLQGEHNNSSEEGLVLDVGAGFGYFSLFGASLGCRVIAWEPVKHLHAFMEYSIARNRLQHKIELRAAAVSAPGGPHATDSATSASIQHLLKPQPQQRRLLARQTPQQLQKLQPPVPQSAGNVTVVAPTRGMWGTASIGGRAIHLALSAGGEFHKHTVPAETLDAVVMPLLSGGHKDQQKQQQHKQQHRHSRVALLKVDTEGHEPEALAGAAQLLGGQLVDNVLLEYSPHIAELHNISQVHQYTRMLLQLLQAGFSLGHVADMNYATRQLSTYSEPLHQLQAITRPNLKFDLLDAAQLTEVGTGWLHEPCREMVSYGLISEGIPERLHPKSFRSTFETHTHVWATQKQKRFAPYVNGPAVGVFAMDRPLSESWFVKESSTLDRGMGGRACRNLREVAAAEGLAGDARAAFLISHRCRCSPAGGGARAVDDDGCADKEQLADACAAAGRTPFREEADFVAS